MKTKITIITAFILATLLINACDAGQAKFEPKTVMEEYITALKEKDVDKIKASSSAKTVKLLESMAKQKNLTLEEMINENEPQIAPMLEKPEIRDEKVQGDIATVEVKNPVDGKWNKVTFVREDNRWKIGAGEMLEDIEKQIKEMRKETGSDTGNSADTNSETTVPNSNAESDNKEETKTDNK